MTTTVLLDLKFKPEALSEAQTVFRRILIDTRAFDGNLGIDVLIDADDDTHWVLYQSWATPEQEEAYHHFRQGAGQVPEMPDLIAAPPVKTIYSTSDI